MARTRRRPGLVLLSFLAACACPAPAGAQEKLELRLRLKPGDVYRTKTTVEQHINQTTGSARQATEQTIGVGYTLTVQKVDAGGDMTLETRYDGIQLKQKGPAGAVEYDSAKEPKQVPQAARPFAALVGLSFRATVTPAGKVTAIGGLDAMLAEMVRRLELPEGPQRAAVQKALTDQFGDDAMKQKLQALFAVYPDGPVAVGDSWRQRVVVSRGLPMVLEYTYTLKGHSDGLAHIETKATLSPNEAAGPVELGTGKMSYDLKGEQSGTADVDEESGWTRSLATTQTVGGTLRYQGSGTPETTSPITIQEKVTMTSEKVGQ